MSQVKDENKKICWLRSQHCFISPISKLWRSPGGLIFIIVAYARNLSYDFRKPYEKKSYVICESVRTYELRKFGCKYTNTYYLLYNLRKDVDVECSRRRQECL